MTDIAELGLAVRSDGVVVATDRLKSLERQSKATEMAAMAMKAVFAVAAAGAVAFGVGVAGAIKRLEEADRMARQLDRALANTGNTARTSSTEVARWADELEFRTGRAAEEVMKVSTNLATFGFGRETFFRAIELANDMSAAWGGDLKQNLEGLSRALDDPEKGFAMLQKRGVQLSDTQKQLVADLMDSNDKLGAQGVVFEALEAQVKGVAEEGYGGLIAAWGRTQEMWDDAFEDVVRGTNGTNDLRDSLTDLAGELGSPEFISAMTGFGSIIIKIVTGIAQAIAGAWKALQDFMAYLNAPGGPMAAVNQVYGPVGGLSTARAEKDLADYEGMLAGGEGLANRAWVEERVQQLKAELAQRATGMDAVGSGAQFGELGGFTTPGTSAGWDGFNPYEGVDFNTLDATAEAQKALNDSRKEGLAITEAMRTPEEQLQADLSRLSELLANGSIDWETYSRAVKSAMETVTLDTGAMVGKVGDILGSLASVMQASGEEGFGVAKGLSVAMAVLKGYEAVTSAYAAGAAIPGGGPITGALYAAAAAAATAAQIANIMSTTSKSTGMSKSGAGGAPSAAAQPVAPAAQPASRTVNLVLPAGKSHWSMADLETLVADLNEAAGDGLVIQTA